MLRRQASRLGQEGHEFFRDNLVVLQTQPLFQKAYPLRPVCVENESSHSNKNRRTETSSSTQKGLSLTFLLPLFSLTTSLLLLSQPVHSERGFPCCDTEAGTPTQTSMLSDFFHLQFPNLRFIPKLLELLGNPLLP